jgi:zinc transporter ZupT
MEGGWALAVACGVVAGLANVVGGWLAVGHHGWDRVRQGYFMAAGAGFMLAAVFLRIVPESYRLSPMDEASTLTVGALILAGYLLVHAAEHVMVGHFHFGEETHHEHWVKPVVGTTALLGLGLHTLLDGVSIGSAFIVEPSLGILVAVAIFLHKIPEGFTIGSIMVASGRSKNEAILAAAWLGLATVAGVLTMSFWSGLVRYALPLSAGAALYVAASDLIPAVNEAKGVRVALGVFGGVILFYLTETGLHRLGF